MCPAASGPEWVARLATELGVPPPTPEEADLLLGLAGVAAHASERTAAPLSTWLVGRAGVPPSKAAEVARRLADGLQDLEDDSTTDAAPGAGDGG